MDVLPRGQPCTEQGVSVIAGVYQGGYEPGELGNHPHNPFSAEGKRFMVALPPAASPKLPGSGGDFGTAPDGSCRPQGNPEARWGELLRCS